MGSEPDRILLGQGPSDHRLKRIAEAFSDVLEASKSYHCSMRIAAYIVAIKRVTRASEDQGLHA